MKYAPWLSALVLFGIVTTACCLFGPFDGEFFGETSVQAQEKSSLPPLKVDRSAPLLLEKPKESSPSKKDDKTADNGACFVCHGNYQEEALAVMHAAEGVGCMKCHGTSHDHRDDEDNITPPDVMYAQEDIRPACEKCHDMHDASAKKVIARWLERCPNKEDVKELVCTDCHGHHRLKFRTSWWDKKTRELIVREPGQRIKTAPE